MASIDAATNRGQFAAVRVASPELGPRAAAYRDLADRILKQTAALLGTDLPTGAAIEIVITEPLPLDEAPAATAGQIIAVAGEETDSSLPERLTGAYFAAVGNEAAAGSRLLAAIVAGIASARAAHGPTSDELGEWAKSALDGGELPSLMTSPEALTGEALQAWRLTAAAFGQWLAGQFGDDAIRRAIAGYDAERRDQALVEAFRSPLGSLEESWHAQLARSDDRNILKALWGQLVPLFKPYWLRQSEAFLYIGYDIAFGIAMPLATKYLIDTVLPAGNVGGLLIFLAVMSGLFLVDILVGVRRNWVNAWINERVVVDLKHSLFARLQRLPHAFHARAQVGDLMERLSNDVDILEMVLWQLASQSIVLVLRAIAASVTLLILSPLLAIVCFLVVPLFGLGYALLAKRIERQSMQARRLMGDSAAIIQEALAAHAVVKAFGLENRVIERFRNTLMAQNAVTMRLVVTGSMYEASLKLATTLGQLLIYGVGGYLVIQGHMTIGVMMAFIGLVPSLFSPVAEFSSMGQAIRSAAGSLDRVTEILEEPLQIVDAPGAAAAPRLSREIVLDNVTFGYDPDRPILGGLTLAIPAGANVAIVGPSGCGKSTTVGLLMRFYDPDEGRVLFDGVDARDIEVASLRAQMGFVFQETFIFNSTLRENIAIGRPTATDSEITAAAEAAQLGEFIAGLPAGYDTVLGERGVRMSGGQRQRLAIARALLRDPDILILDEATSALDTQTEADVLRTLAEAARGRTTISITHRLTSVQSADRIYVLDRGRLAESGTFADLMERDGVFRKLYERQLQTVSGASRIGAEIEDVLADMPVFAGLEPDDLAALAGGMTVREYPAETEVVREGDAGDGFFVILDGMAEVVAGPGALERHVATLGGGDYFGEMALVSGQPRTATVRTLKPSTIARMPQEVFDDLVDASPGVRESLDRVMQARLAQLTEALAA